VTDNGHLISLIDQGFTASQIAAKFGCTKQHIRTMAKKLPGESLKKLNQNGKARQKRSKWNVAYGRNVDGKAARNS